MAVKRVTSSKRDREKAKQSKESLSNANLLMNEYWVRPSEAETPQKARQIEAGCYW